MLSLVLLTPLVGLLVLLLIPSSNQRAIKLWANLASFAGFLVTLPLIFQFDKTKDFQFVEKMNWIPSIGASYHLGIDGYALLLVVLRAGVTDQESAMHAQRMLDDDGTPLLGTILNDWMPKGSHTGYYDSYSRYYAPSKGGGTE